MALINLTKNRYKRLTIGLHIVIWLFVIQIFFSLEGLFYSFYEIAFEKDKIVFDEAFIIIPSIIILFYLNSLAWIPKYANRKNWVKYLLFIIGFLISFTLLGFIVYKSIIDFGYLHNESIWEFFDMLLTTNIAALVVSFAIGITKEMLQRTDEMLSLKEQQQKMELHYLQSQIQPHFLFNTLNTLYSLAIAEDALKTTDGILGLSEMMRYGLTQNDSNLVSISEEANFIESYIEFQRIKLGGDYPVVFEKDIVKLDKKVMSMCLIPIVENAFKYGVSQQNKAPIIFHLSINENRLNFSSTNEMYKGPEVESHKIGLNNLKQRLQLMYRNEFILDIKSKENQFLVVLEIPLK